MGVNIEDVKKLREETNVSISACKEALDNSGGDFDKAREYLKQMGLKIAAKKAHRTLGSGVIQAYVHTNNKVAAMIELLSETDFVSNNEEFIALAKDIALHAATMGPIYVSRDSVPQNEIDKVKKEAQKKVPQDKPKETQKNILQGLIDAHFKEIILLEQPYVRDDSKTINDLVLSATHKFGERIEIGKMTIYTIG